VFNSCDATPQDTTKPFSSVASALLLHGFPAVLAMSSRISDGAAIAFSGSFYERLADGASVAEAVREGRLMMKAFKGGEWKKPILFLPTRKAEPRWQLLVAAVVLAFICVATGEALLHLRQTPIPPIPMVDIDLAERATVPSELLVSGSGRAPRRSYYLFVRDPGTRQCYIQERGPLTLNQDSRWQTLARFSGNPGQAFQLIAVAAPRPLKPAEWTSCGGNVPGIRSAERSVRLGSQVPHPP